MSVPITAVMFDFHATLVDQGDADRWLDRAIAHAGAGVDLDGLDRAAVAARIDSIWMHARDIDPGSERDLSARAHRDTFHAVMAGHAPSELTQALYDVMLGLWSAYEDAPGVLAELRRRCIRTAIVSNVGIDIRPLLEAEGLAVDVTVLSCEIGIVKPDPRIFAVALELLGVCGDEALMVGDSWTDDAAAAALGIRTLILPRTRGRHHGLGQVLRLVD